MIQADYFPAEGKLTIHGHAGSAPKGADLICAGATVLAEALEAAVYAMQEHEMAKNICIRRENGTAEISCEAVSGCEGVVHGAFLTAAAGMRWLEKYYPEYVRINIH